MQEFFGDSNGVLTERLQAVGFTAEQASGFLTAAASGILHAFQHKDIEEIIATMGSDEPTKLLGSVNVSAIANKIGVNAYQVTTGFEAIMPDMAKAFLNNSGGIINAAASIAWGLPGDIHKLDKKPVL